MTATVLSLACSEASSWPSAYRSVVNMGTPEIPVTLQPAFAVVGLDQVKRTMRSADKRQLKRPSLGSAIDVSPRRKCVRCTREGRQNLSRRDSFADGSSDGGRSVGEARPPVRRGGAAGRERPPRRSARVDLFDHEHRRPKLLVDRQDPGPRTGISLAPAGCGRGCPPAPWRGRRRWRSRPWHR